MHVFAYFDLGDHIHGNVGFNPFCLNGAPLWGVITGGGEFQGAVLAQRQYRLYGAFAEGAVAHHDGAFLVLQGAGHDFRGGGAAAVDQHHQRFAVQGIAGAGIKVVSARLVAALGVHHQAGIQEQVGDFHGAVEHAAGVIAQIKNQAVKSTVLVELVQRFAGVVTGVVLELGNAQVAQARFQHF